MFVVLLDPFWATLKSATCSFSKFGAIRAYADDIAIVAPDILETASILDNEFQKFAEISNLHLKTSECIIVPLWRITAANLTTLLQIYHRPWANMKIDHAAKYLGLFLGTCLPI